MTAVREVEAATAVDGVRARRDAGLRLAALVSAWAAVLLVVYWWVTGRGVQDLGGWSTGLSSLGRLTGLLAAVLLLFQVLLMARIPLLEGAFGQDRLARLHRLTGFTSFNLMLAHIGLITWGYAAGDLWATPRTFWDLTTDYPGMLLAVAGTICLILVVVTSIKAARRKLRYESWHLLHLYAYLGVGLALPHQLWTGQDFVGSLPRTVFWWGLWIAAVAAILLFRVTVPLVRMAGHRIRVTDVVNEGDGVVSVHMSNSGTPISAESGQFFTFRFLSGSGWTRANPYSLSAAPARGRLRITAKVVGDGSGNLRALRPGTRVLVEGPYGRLSARARTRPRIALIGAGVGVTPLRALAEELSFAPGEAVLLYRFSGRPLFEAELRELSASRGLQVIWLPGRRRAQGSWLNEGIGRASDAEALKFWVPDIADRDVYVCGPQGWAQDVRAATRALGVPAERLHAESFGW